MLLVSLPCAVRLSSPRLLTNYLTPCVHTAYEKHQEAEGKPQSHQLAKELLAGFAGAEVDKLFETKGLDFLDREKAKRHAQQEAEQAYDQQYNN